MDDLCKEDRVRLTLLNGGKEMSDFRPVAVFSSGNRRMIELPKEFPTIITLCGSTRFKEEFIQANYRLTMDGYIVLSVGWFSYADAKIFSPSHEEKENLDRLHLRKIDLSDEIFVINPYTMVCSRCRKPARLFTALSQETECCRSKDWWYENYIGESTKREITYATENGKVVKYLVTEEKV